MRMLIHLWMVLTLVLGICGDDMVRRAAEDRITYEGSGTGSGQLPLTNDDEDYQSSSVSSFYDDEYGSGSTIYGGSSQSSFSSDIEEEEENTNLIRMRGEFTIEGISRGNLEWMPDLANTNSKPYNEFARLIAPIIRRALEANKTTKNGLVSVKIIGFRHGSIITEYQAEYTPDSSVTPDQIRRSLKSAVEKQSFGDLTVDPRSVSHVSRLQPAGVVLTDAPPTKVTKAVTPQKPAKETDPPRVPTTQSNAIDKKTDPPNKPEPTNNEVGNGVIDIDGTPEEDPDNLPGNNLDQKNNPEPSPQNFWDLLFSHPAILAGLVGAVVLALLTVVLLLMFIVYRIKKKDEGSYSLDEPHKVKDPMAYWKDTKEFYA